ncbi:radical SAM (seleno)protein TrsS [Geosporobacter ferrireducens]|uniref:radical SAM (seleno)protein TrsS n=1 Tax=Geosporobacter ferrireducens TaxID=1424294 RepID=UPI00139BDEA4|nr:radical SAM (seleno)protein TrsS [Geosporobacter ferrireducens]MTI57775.1 radical SAM protein [Geosporobacter ferrireducens]
MDRIKIISKTQSLCPVCLKKVGAQIYNQGSNTYMVKSCSEHGVFKTVVWKGSIPMEEWVRKKERAYIKNPITATEKGCPFDCGLCSGHRQHTCTALIEVTQNCNLHCSFCFADSNGCREKDPDLEQIELQYKSVLKASGRCNIQLSGGEPTVRKDLPLIIKMGTVLGFPFIQVNTNGIRMGEDESYVKALKNAGLRSIFLQFDGTNDDINIKLRGRELLDVKIRAIENCKKYGIGVVLVPTLVPGINLDNIGSIIDFALEHAPVVRGVHFQPVSYFGRAPSTPSDKDRVTLPEVMEAIEMQTAGKIRKESLKPPGCENALCSFHGSYLLDEKRKLMNITKRSGCGCEGGKAEEGAVKAKAYVSRNWSYRKEDHLQEKSNTVEMQGWDEILNRIHNHSFSISAMAFQDVWNVDLERVKDCCIHVVNPDGRLIPFCLYNLSDIEGRYLYRKRNETKEPSPCLEMRDSL